ncbi:hypothetical protein niasHT_027759 [Heterodera trifolii]|uniref:Transposase n=1 Tax=Heterodera trifolii TaxID=157864 RepID=A0ABD2KIW8_9BILA
MVAKNICAIHLLTDVFRRLRQFVPSILNDCPSLRIVSFIFDDFFTEFPCDDSANASNGQSVAKWLFTVHSNNVPKLFKCWLNNDDGKWSSNIAAFKAACWSVVQLHETRANGQNGRRKRLDGKWITN